MNNLVEQVLSKSDLLGCSVPQRAKIGKEDDGKKLLEDEIKSNYMASSYEKQFEVLNVPFHTETSFSILVQWQI